MTWLLSPIGRWATAVGAALSILLAAYVKGRREGAAAIEREQQDERERRAKAALDAGDAVRRDNASGRLYENDGNRRD